MAEAEILPAPLGKRPAAELRRVEIREWLAASVKVLAPYTAHRVFQLLRRVRRGERRPRGNASQELARLAHGHFTFSFCRAAVRALSTPTFLPSIASSALRRGSTLVLK